VVVTASISGIFRTVLIIIGAIVLLRFLGQLMIAKRNMEAERILNKNQREGEAERQRKMKSFGKTTILGKPNTQKESKSHPDIMDVDYEEIK
jgi:hypothetical protein